MGEKGNFLLNLLAVLVIVALFLPLVFANILNTSMTWVVPSNKTHSLGYGASCSATAFYFVESDANFDSDVDGNAAMVAPNSSSSGGVGTLCQSDNIAPITVTNSGNVAINIDANVNPDFNGNDRNLVLKVWMGVGSGCDMNAAGLYNGWQSNCGTISATTAVTQALCKDFNAGDSNAYSRLTTSLGVGGTNSLCFSGDFGSAIGLPSAVPEGSYVHSFDTNAS